LLDLQNKQYQSCEENSLQMKYQIFVTSHFSISSATISFYKFSEVLSFQKDKTYINNAGNITSNKCLWMISQDPLTQHQFFCHISAVLLMSLETHQSSWLPNVAQCYYLFCLEAMSGTALQKCTLFVCRRVSHDDNEGSIANSPMNENFLKLLWIQATALVLC